MGGEFGFEVEVGEVFEEAEYFGLREYVRKDSKITTELTKPCKVHLTLFISIERIKGKKRSMDHTQNLHNLLVSKHF